MPQRSLSSDFGFGSGEAPPSYDTSFTPEEFEAKAAAVAEESRVNHGKQRAVEESGPSLGSKGSSGDYDEFEDWDDAKFAAAAAAYQLRLARMQQSANPHTASSSTNRAQTPRVDAGMQPVASTSRAASPRPADRTQPPQNPTHNPGQLPATQFDTSLQRNLPQQPTDAYRGGPLNSHNQQPTYTPQQTVAPQASANSSQPWMSGASSDGHGRGSMDVPPPFASMDPSMEFASSPTNETHQNGPVSQQQAPSEIREDIHSTIPPPPPLNISQAPASAPLQPTTSSSPPAFVPPHVMHRHSDIPSSTANTHNASLPARPRLSDVPSVSGRSSGPSVPSSARTPPPNFPGAQHSSFPGFVLPYDKKPTFAPNASETTSRSQALYASANVRMNAPSVRIDLNKLAYSEHSQSQPAHGVKDGSHAPGSFYSSSVSSVMKKRPLPQPQTRRGTNESQYSVHGVSPPHAMPYGASPPMPMPTPTAFNAQSAQNHVNQGFYPHPHMQSPEVSTSVQYQPAPQQQQYQQQQQPQMYHDPSQGYPLAMQNHWTPAPWNHYGHF